MSEITFGCGEFLPGEGPFSFPDFSGGGTVNGGSPDLEFEPTDPGVTSPPDIKYCECRPKAVGTQVVANLGSDQLWTYWVVSVDKECVEIVNGFPADNSTEVIQNLQALAAAIPRAVLLETEPGTVDCADPPPVPGEPEEELPCSEKTCDPIQVFYKTPRITESGGPTSLPPTGPGRPTNVGPRSARNCKCTIVGNPVEFSEPNTNGGFTSYAIFERKCVDRNVEGRPSREVINEWFDANVFPPCTPDSYAVLDIPCVEVAGECDPNFTCTSVRVSYYCPPPDAGDPDPVEEEPPIPGDVIPDEVPEDPSGPPFEPIDDQVNVGDPQDPEDPTGPPFVPIGNQEDAGLPEDPEGPPVPGVLSPDGVPDTSPPGPGVFNFVRINDQTEEGGVISNKVISPPPPPEGDPERIATPPILPLQRVDTFSPLTEKQLLDSAFSKSKIDLSDDAVVNALLKKLPAGIEDEEVYFNVAPKKRKLVRNTSTKTNIFNNHIDESLLYLLERPLDYGSWDSGLAGAITPQIIYENLNKQAKSLLDKVINYDGSKLSTNQIFSIVGSRVLDGTIADVNLSFLQRLALGSEEDTEFGIIPSKYQLVNESVALALIESNYKPLDFNKYAGQGRELLKNKKTLSSDIDRFIEVTVAGEVRRYYVKDDDTFINRSTLSLNDGEYFDVTLGGEVTRLYAKSEKDHAFYIPEKIRQVAIKLLGGSPDRYLSVSGDVSSTIELSSSLTSPRQNAYFLSANLSTISTELSLINPKYLKQTSLNFEVCPISSIESINEYIKYKDNHQVFIMNDEDLILDYVETNGYLRLEQTDIILDSPKENKTIPLLTRQVPWYIILYPTNRPEYDVFNVKSQITNITPSSTEQAPSLTRKLRTKTSIVKEFRNSEKFVKTPYVGRTARDIFDNPNTQARINIIDLDSEVFSSGYKNSSGFVIPASSFSPQRSKTGYRILSEIIKSLDNNYLLGLNGIGKSLTEFDVFCRLTLKQFNKLYRLENFPQIKNSLFNGAVQNVKVVPARKNSDSRLANNKTQLVRRKSTAPSEDEFPEVKSTNFGRAIVPPTVEEDSTFGSFEPAPVPTPPTALP